MGKQKPPALFGTDHPSLIALSGDQAIRGNSIAPQTPDGKDPQCSFAPASALCVDRHGLPKCPSLQKNAAARPFCQLPLPPSAVCISLPDTTGQDRFPPPPAPGRFGHHPDTAGRFSLPFHGIPLPFHPADRSSSAIPRKSPPAG